ncbi:6-phosphogluconolactonase [Sulfitobacter guttiformis]|nr:6-phosphogluconolactonase [Sulfitobacter guttiformis]KIN72373.1 6-phosphogluconolactonase [Sulfitobacter guttiformis KCTC 32187]
MKLVEYTTSSEMMPQVAKALATELEQALKVREKICFAVPGGSTPGPVFDTLSTAEIDWARVNIILTDERWVPESDAQSNAALIRKRLLVNNAAAASFAPFFIEDTEIATAAALRSAQLSQLLPVDVLLLGMGADMHTASLFPGAQGLDAALATDAPMLLAVSVEGQQIRRLTLTAPVLRNAGSTHVLITGAEKRAAVARAATLPEAQAPIRTVLDTATLHWSAQ